MSRHRLALACLGALALGLAAVGRAAIYRSIAADLQEFEFGLEGDGEPFAADADRLAAIESGGRAIRPLHREKRPPAPGDWLAKHPDDGQSFAIYRDGRPNHPGSRRTTLYVQPWGDFEPARREVVALTASFLGEFYGVPVRTLEPHGLGGVPAHAQMWDAELGMRLNTSYVLMELRGVMPDDAVAVLALTTVDLTRGGKSSWVFGEASLTGRVGVCSLYRHGDPAEDFTLCLRRTLRTAVHETGHMLGIAHCAAFECAMNGSSSRNEADRQPVWFCPQDEMKVWLGCPVDPAGRYARLAAFAESNGLETEARFWRRSRDTLTGSAPPHRLFK